MPPLFSVIPRTGVAVTHWSLPAVERINGSEVPALFTAGRLDDGEPAETLEIEDSDMIAALDTIHVVLVQRRPHPGRLRGVMVVSFLTIVALLAVVWLPGAMIRHTASVLPQATRVQIGKLALQDLGPSDRIAVRCAILARGRLRPLRCACPRPASARLRWCATDWRARQACPAA